MVRAGTKKSLLSFALPILLGLSACSGGLGSGSGPGPVGGSGNITDTNVPGPAPLARGANAAAPTLGGILSAPADDDGIDTGTRGSDVKVMHFEAFFGKNYQSRIDRAGTYTKISLSDLTFLIKVGEYNSTCADKADSNSPVDLSCLDWFDPNILKGLVARIWVMTQAPADSDPSAIHLLKSVYYYQDCLLSEVTPGGFNLSLMEMNLKEGDEFTILLYNKMPEDYSAQRSADFDNISYAHAVGLHNLGNFKAVDLWGIQVRH